MTTAGQVHWSSSQHSGSIPLVTSNTKPVTNQPNNLYQKLGHCPVHQKDTGNKCTDPKRRPKKLYSSSSKKSSTATKDSSWNSKSS